MEPELRIYRAVVRGRFADLDDDTRARLTAALDDHDAFKSAFTAAGTLTYEKAIDFFNVRCEIRDKSDSPAESEAAAERLALQRTEDLLTDLGAGWRDLKVTLTNMADMWR